MENSEIRPAIVILAAGLGKRMKSPKAKVLHEVHGKAMVMYVVETAIQVAGNDVILVVGNQAESVRKIVSETYNVLFARQEEQLGTGHAVQCAFSHIPAHCNQVIILCGDVPLIRSDTISQLLHEHVAAQRDLTLLAVSIDDPKGYGRVLRDENGNVTQIVEEADATEKQRKIRTINTGIYCVNKGFLADALGRIKSDNAQKEYYLTDVVQIGSESGKIVGMINAGDFEEFLGVNTPQDLMRVEEIMQKRPANKS